jgi:hypothetical protein
MFHLKIRADLAQFTTLAFGGKLGECSDKSAPMIGIRTQSWDSVSIGLPMSLCYKEDESQKQESLEESEAPKPKGHKEEK